MDYCLLLLLLFATNTHNPPQTEGHVAEVTMTFDPFSALQVKYMPAFLLQLLNNHFGLREPEQLYELQYSSFAIPESLYNFRCYHHLEKMRESYAFVLYFVITDSLFYFVPIVVCSFSLVRFVQELKKSLDFQRRAASTAATAATRWVETTVKPAIPYLRVPEIRQ